MTDRELLAQAADGEVWAAKELEKRLRAAELRHRAEVELGIEGVNKVFQSGEYREILSLPEKPV